MESKVKREKEKEKEKKRKRRKKTFEFKKITSSDCKDLLYIEN